MGDFENALHRGRTEACKKMDRNKNRRCRNQQCIQAHLTSVDLWEGKLKNWKCSRVTVKTIAGVINEVFFFCFLFCRGSFIKTWTVHWDCQPFPLPLHQEQRWISPRAVCTLWSKNKGFCVYVCVCAHYCISNRYLISYLTLWWRKRAFVGFLFFLDLFKDKLFITFTVNAALVSFWRCMTYDSSEHDTLCFWKVSAPRCMYVMLMTMMMMHVVYIRTCSSVNACLSVSARPNRSLRGRVPVVFLWCPSTRGRSLTWERIQSRTMMKPFNRRMTLRQTVTTLR